MRHPAPERSLHLGLRPGELDGRPYAPFWNPRMAPLPDEAREALLHGPVASALLPKVTDAPRLLDEGDQALEDGYGLGDDGSLHVAVRTAMPGVSPVMVDWWFGWHGSEAGRYKLWHPRAHVHAAWGSEAPRGAWGRERYVGRTSFVDEYIGSALQQATIRFVDPVALGFDGAALDDPERATAVCARIGPLRPSIEVGHLVHHVRRVEGGAEMRSRFWLGGAHAAARSERRVEAAVVQVARRWMRPTAAQGHELLVHCSQEMTHLAGFLPALYARCRDVE